MKPKTDERQQARELRLQGLAIPKIAATLHVSKASVSLWVRDIELSEEQKTELANRSKSNSAKGTAGLVTKYRRIREEFQEEGRRKAQVGDWRHAAACMLYWAEGTKRRNHVQIANSDPALLRFFIEFLQDYFNVDDSEIAIGIDCYLNNGISQEEIEVWWLAQLGLRQGCLRKTTVRVPDSQGIRGHSQRRLSQGVCKVSVGRTDILQHIYGALQEYAGFQARDYLD